MTAPTAVLERPGPDAGAADREVLGRAPVVSGGEPVTASAALMGGQVAVSIVAPGSPASTARDAERVLRRIAAWADRLTRFSPDSDLSRVNRDPRELVPLTPTMVAILDQARSAEHLTDGIVDVAWLDARLAAEGLALPTPHPGAASRAWSLERSGPRATSLRRPVGLHLDLDGVAKGWLADRALALLPDDQAALVDADGDIALRVVPGRPWSIGVAHPTEPDTDLLVLTLTTDGSASRSFGVATSGTSVHRWREAERISHHLIDPRTGRPAATDLVQATVVARSAAEAEALAKSAVILGSGAAVAMLERVGVAGAILVGDDGVTLLDSTWAWLA